MGRYYDHRDPFKGKTNEEKLEDIYSPLKAPEVYLERLLEKIGEDKVTEIKATDLLNSNVSPAFRIFHVHVSDGDERERFEYFYFCPDLGLLEDEENERYIIEARAEMCELIISELIENRFKHLKNGE